MLPYSLGAVAAGLEALGFWFMFGLGRSFDSDYGSSFGANLSALGMYLGAHAAASVLAALVMVASLPGPSRLQPRRAALFFGVLCFFVPVLGVPGLLTAAFVAHLMPKRGSKDVFATVPLPEFAPHDDRAGQHEAPHAHGPVRAQLAATSSPAETRMRALLSIQELPSRVANPIIRGMLADPSDDVRLVAYGILDSREKVINARIQAARAQLVGEDPLGRLQAEKELAELYWELVYQGLVQGDLQKHAAAQARSHFDAALALAPEDAALWSLGGRLAIFSGHYERARHAFTRAIEFGLPEVRALPYLAEVAFRTRHFDQVREILERIAETSHTQRMAQVIDYWTAPGVAHG